MCPHLMEIRVSERKVTSDPLRPKKTSKTKKPKPTHLRKVHPAHNLNWTVLLLIPFGFVTNVTSIICCFCNFLTTVSDTLLLLCVCGVFTIMCYVTLCYVILCHFMHVVHMLVNMC